MELLQVNPKINGKVSFSYYSDLAELAKELGKGDVPVIITADTSIAHLVNRLGYVNVSVYNVGRCDVDSLQSLSSDSPLGFGRYFPHQVPVLLDAKRSEGYLRSLARNIVQGVTSIMNPPQETEALIAEPFVADHQSYASAKARILGTSLQWAAEIYDPEKLLTPEMQANPGAKYLCEAVIKLSPLFKLRKLLEREQHEH